MKTLITLALLLWASFPAWSQQSVDCNIYFDFNSAEVKPGDSQALDSVLEKYSDGIESVTLAGRTDSVGNIDFNYRLAQERINKVAVLLANKNIRSVVKEISYGETNPLAGNATDEGRTKNRSVNISIGLSEAFTRGVDFIYQRFGTKADTFDIHNNHSTVLRTKNNIIIKIPANAFVNDKGHPIAGKVNVKVIECMNYYDMLLTNLTTQTDKGEMLETAGMLKIEAEWNGKNLNLGKNKSIQIKIPADTLVKGMRMFYGKQDSAGMTWERAQPANDSITYGIAGMNELLEESRLRTMSLVIPERSPENDMTFDVTNETLKYNFDVLYMDNPTSLQKDSLKFLIRELTVNGRTETAGRLIGSLVKKYEEKKANQVIKHLGIEEISFLMDVPLGISSNGIYVYRGKTMRYLNLKDPVFAGTDFSKVKYIYYTIGGRQYGTEVDSNFNTRRINVNNYIMNVTNLQWINCDRYRGSNTTEMIVNSDSDIKPVLRLAFRRFKTVISPTSATASAKHYNMFNRIPDGEEAVLIAYAMKDGSPYLATKKVVTGQNRKESLHLEKVSLEEFERQMKSIN